jgi:uncharacterized lipoprotein YehR (DUF1307 family)
MKRTNKMAAMLVVAATLAGGFASCSDNNDAGTDPVVDGITLYYHDAILNTPVKPGDTLVAKLNIVQTGDIYIGQGNGGTVKWTVSYPGDTTVVKDCSYDKIGIATFNSPRIATDTIYVQSISGASKTAQVTFSMKYSYKTPNANGQLYGSLSQSTSFTVVNPDYVEEED